MSGRIDFTLGFPTRNDAHKNPGINGFRIYILGNFSGHSDIPWQQRKIRKIDCDNFDQVVGQIMPTLEFDSGLTLRFTDMEAFHPDAWFKKVPILADLQQLKRDLDNPDTAEQAAAKIQAYCQSNMPAAPATETARTDESQEDLLERLLGDKPTQAKEPSSSADQLIDRLVSPYIKKDSAPQQQVMLNIIDTMLGRFVGTLLHQPDFQRMEALWRATEALVNEETGDEQCFFLVDIDQDEITNELAQNRSDFEQRLIDHIRSGENKQDVLLIGDHYFTGSAEDHNLLHFFAKLAKSCAGCFLSGADTSLVAEAVSDKPDHLAQWTKYLTGIDSGNAILSYPRYLLRLPYGSKREPIDSFDFEECADAPQTNELLWGNPAFLCARVLMKTQESPRDEHFYFDDTPTFTFTQDGEPVLQPAAETLLNESQANALLAQNIMPLIGFRQRPGIRLLAVSPLSGG